VNSAISGSAASISARDRPDISPLSTMLRYPEASWRKPRFMLKMPETGALASIRPALGW
jgi:hypothetical protein